MAKDKEAFLEIFHNCLGDITQSCEKSNIVKSTFHRWIKTDEDFANTTKEIIGTILDFTETALHGEIRKGNIKGIIYKLDNKGKKRGYNSKKENLPPQIIVTKATEITPVYAKTLKAIREGYKIIINRGGTRSSKSVSTVQLIADWLCTGYIGSIHAPKGLAEILRKWQNRAMDSIGRDLLEILEKRGYSDLRFNGNSFLWKENGVVVREIQILGMDSAQKAKGKKRLFSYMDEADEFTSEDYRNIMSRNELGLVFMTFNPSAVGWIRDELEVQRAKDKKDVIVITSSYKDNSFLPPANRENIEYLCSIDPWYNTVYGKGEYSESRNKVYKFETYDKLPERSYYTIMGLDWGSTSPTAICVVKIDKETRDTFVEEIYYDRTSDPIRAGAKIVEYWNKEGGEFMVICDTNMTSNNHILRDYLEEKTNKAVSVDVAKKGGGSVMENITFIQHNLNLKMYYSSLDLIKEIKNYRYKIDRSTDKPVDDIVRANDHLLDAMRYSIIAFRNMHYHFWIDKVKKNEKSNK